MQDQSRQASTADVKSSKRHDQSLTTKYDPQAIDAMQQHLSERDERERMEKIAEQ